MIRPPPGSTRLPYAALSRSGWAITAGALGYGPQDLAPGASVHVHIVSTTGKNNCGTPDTATTVTTTNACSDQDEASVVVNCGQIAISKVADAATVSSGDQIG